MPVNELILDNAWFGLLFMFFLEFAIIIIGFLLFNAIYRDKKYFKKSLVALIIMILYQLIINKIGNVSCYYLRSNYNRHLDLIFSYTSPFMFLGSMTTLYLGIKHNKKYFILYLYNIFFFISLVSLGVNPSQANVAEALYPVGYILFLFTYFIPLLLFFIQIKEDGWNILKQNQRGSMSSKR